MLLFTTILQLTGTKLRSNLGSTRLVEYSCPQQSYQRNQLDAMCETTATGGGTTRRYCICDGFRDPDREEQVISDCLEPLQATDSDTFRWSCVFRAFHCTGVRTLPHSSEISANT